MFPELREWCQERRLYLVECDLRWGVPNDSTSEDTVAICMEELDKCLQETDGEPFFLNLLGEKYAEFKFAILVLICPYENLKLDLHAYELL